jgi:hypothetical protein
MKTTLPLIILCLLVGAGTYEIITGREEKTHAEFLQAIERIQAKQDQFAERLSALEARKIPGESRPPVLSLPNLSSPPKPPLQKSPALDRVVDRPPPDSTTCTFATINSTTKLASTLTWNPSDGGTYVGDLPMGSIVEILTSTLYIWNDYPDEHGLYVRVVESPKSPQMENQTGYIEMKRIGYKRCNLGVEFDK